MTLPAPLPTQLPNSLPRPEDELARLEAAWKPPSGWKLLTAVNNTHIGIFYVATAFAFFIAAGILALLMRLQLAVPENTFLDQATYNQMFTMHGTVMMFLFAVPVVEAIGVLLLPNMLAARDLPRQHLFRCRGSVVRNIVRTRQSGHRSPDAGVRAVDSERDAPGAGELSGRKTRPLAG